MAVSFLPTDKKPKPRKRTPKKVEKRTPAPKVQPVIAGDPHPRVLIDDRAGSRDLVDYPPLNSCGDLCRLDSADALIVGDKDGVIVGVEVKSISDFISSLETGRLQAGQIPAMLKTYDESWLLVYGRWRATSDGQLEVWKESRGSWYPYALGTRPVPYGYVESRLVSMETAGVKTRTVERIEDAAQWIGVLARWWAKGRDGHRTFKKFSEVGRVPTSALIAMDGPMKLRAEMAACLPGVGFDRAIAAAKYFPSVRDMVNATREEWEEVEGVGKVVAGAVVGAMK